MLLKSWLEVRWRLMLMLLLNLFVGSIIVDDSASAQSWIARLSGISPMIFAMNAIVLAGSGIPSQISQRPGQVVHPSMMFLLSLPISRTRIVVMRQAVGAVASVGLMLLSLTALLVAAPESRAVLLNMHGAVYVACVAAALMVAYSVSALLSTVLDQLWQTYGAMAILAALVGVFPASRFWSGVLRSDGTSVAESDTLIAAVTGLIACTLSAGALVLASVAIVRRKQF